MSTWGIGANDVSQQTQALKDAASSKESENAALRSTLMKRDEEFAELKATLNETLRKLSHEADRALNLESELTKTSQDLAYHKVASQNAEKSLLTANAKLRESELAERELQSHLEVLSNRHDTAKDGNSKLEKEKKALEARVRELDAEFRQLAVPASAIPKKAGRARSSSVSTGNGKNNNAFEQELGDTRALLTAKESNLRSASDKLARVQTDLVQSQNEHLAAEKKFKRQIGELEASLEDKEDELAMLRAEQGDGGREREEELMKRVEEDEAKILALERLAGDGQKIASVKATLDRTEKMLKAEIKRVEAAEKRCAKVMQERDEVLDELVMAQTALQKKEEDLVTITIQDKKLQTQFTTLQAEFAAARHSSSSAAQSNPSGESTPMPQPMDDTPADAAEYLATLLSAIDRLRAERDGLRRDLNFLEAEHKFAVQSLDAKPPTMVAPSKRAHDVRLAVMVTASAVVAQHMQAQFENMHSQCGTLKARLAEATAACESKDSASKDLTTKIEALQAASLLHSELESELQKKIEHSTEEARQSRRDHRDAQEALAQAYVQLSGLAKAMEIVESQRDSLNVQLTNFQTDLTEKQGELEAAQARYGTLQAHQLSAMPSTDVSRSLRQQIEELEGRVLRRTELIGILQHDVKRLDTNLRLQEERLGEMTGELETLGAQKDAMVEDCADAREARDGAVEKCECLEMEVEALEGRLEAAEAERLSEAATLTAVIAETTGRLRTSADEVCRLVEEKRQTEQHLAVTRGGLAEQNALTSTNQEENAMLRERVQTLEDDIVRQVATSRQLEQQCNDLRQQLDASAAAAGDNSQAHHALALVKAELDLKSKALSISSAAKDDLANELHSLRTHSEQQTDIVKQLEHQVQALHEGANTKAVELQENAAQTQQAILALALLQASLKKHSASFDASIGREKQLQQELSALREDLAGRAANALRLEESLEDLQKELSVAKAAHAGASADACQTAVALAVAHRGLTAASSSAGLAKEAEVDLLNRVHAAEDELKIKAADAKRLEQQLSDLRERSNANAVAESGSIDQLRAQHLEEMDALQKTLADVSSELEQANQLHSEVETGLRESIEQARRSKEELEERLAAVLKQTKADSELESELARVQVDHVAEVARLQGQLHQIGQDLQGAITLRAEAERLHQEAIGEINGIKEEYEKRTSDAAIQGLDATRQLEGKLAAAQAKHAEQIARVEAKLEQTVAEVGSLQLRLQREVDDREEDRRTHISELQEKTEECHRAESLETELHQEIALTRTQLDQTQAALEELDAERITLQTQTTSFTADVHRIKALNIHLENEMKSCEARNTQLQEILDKTRADLSRSEKSGKENEYQLSIECANQEKIATSLRRELASLKTLPNLEGVVAELEEKARDMDELLRGKCEEIEANDDRVFEMLKEKKKLTAKVDLLTRKVQSLQAKLATTSEAAPSTRKATDKYISSAPTAAAATSSTSSTRRLSSSSQHVRLSQDVPPVPAMPTQPAAERSRSSRVASGPAIISRPKTPERKISQPVVFKARTPERRATPKTSPPPTAFPDSIASSSSVSSIGKKRARPDEFDSVSVPVSALYAADEERENATPRLRRALNSMQTGFTPVRARAAQSQQSPSRRATAGLGSISDMTNSPSRGDSAKASKRSWLGKIRGGPSSTRTPATRPGVFERAPGP